MYQCNRWGKNQTCDFDMKDMMALVDEEPTQLFGRVEEDKCAKCDHDDNKCEVCECGSGTDCVKADECSK
jgi:hypothetical protein